MLPLPSSEATVESVEHGGAGYNVVLLLVGENEEVRIQTRWKERDGRPTVIEAGHLSKVVHAAEVGRARARTKSGVGKQLTARNVNRGTNVALPFEGGAPRRSAGRPDELGGQSRLRRARLHEPESIEQLQEIVRNARSLRVLGSRHSFNDIADTTGDLVSLTRMPRVFDLDPAAGTVTVDGGVRYGELCGPLDAAGFALHNLASLPAHLRGRRLCDRDPWLRRPDRQPRDGGLGDGGGHRRRRDGRLRPGSRPRRSQWRRGFVGRPRRGHVAHPRAPAHVPDAPGPLRGPAAGPGRGPLRRDRLERGQREPVHEWRGPVLRAGLAQAPGPRRRHLSSLRPRCSARPSRQCPSTRSGGCRQRPAPSSWASSARGTSDCRISGWTTRRAAAPSSRPST